MGGGLWGAIAMSHPSVFLHVSATSAGSAEGTEYLKLHKIFSQLHLISGGFHSHGGNPQLAGWFISCSNVAPNGWFISWKIPI